MKRILIVANQTAAGSHLREVVRRRLREGECTFTLLVPATPPQEHVLYTDGEANALARDRLEEALEPLRALGADVEGVVGDASPMTAIGDRLLEQDYDEIVLSTLTPGVSRWLKQDLPHRVERRFGIPVTHIVGSPSTSAHQ